MLDRRVEPIDFPLYNYFRLFDDPSPAAHTLILYRDQVVLPPSRKDPDGKGWLLGPFWIALCCVNGSLSWQAALPQEAVAPEWIGNRYSPHPNIQVTPCYGDGDTGRLINTLAQDGDWPGVLFAITRFLETWNPRDQAYGRLEDLARGRVEWHGPPIDEGDERKASCETCSEEVDDVDRLDPDGRPICQACFDVNVRQCAECEQLCWAEDSMSVNRLAFCSVCFEDLFYHCANCDEIVARSQPSDPDERLCDDCYDKEEDDEEEEE